MAVFVLSFVEIRMSFDRLQSFVRLRTPFVELRMTMSG
jgi:hypothetical protein